MYWGLINPILGIPAKHESIDFPIGLDTSHVRHTCASQLVQQWGGIPQNGNFHEDDDDKSINSLAFWGTPLLFSNWLITLISETANQRCPVYHWRLVWKLLELVFALVGLLVSFRVKRWNVSFWWWKSGWIGNRVQTSGFWWFWTGQGWIVGSGGSSASEADADESPPTWSFHIWIQTSPIYWLKNDCR